jgi:trk system potassium uptake protein TrkH
MRDSQVRAYILTIALIALILALYRVTFNNAIGNTPARGDLQRDLDHLGDGIRLGGLPALGRGAGGPVLLRGLIGGCAGSTSCSIKVFRYQLLFASISTQVSRLYAPHGMFEPRYDGRPSPEEVVSSVMAFFVLFFVALGIIAVLLGLTGLDFVTSVSGAATALGNIGPGLGEVIGPSGNYARSTTPPSGSSRARCCLGRLELIAVLVLFTAAFWRA